MPIELMVIKWSSSGHVTFKGNINCWFKN